VPFVYLRGPKSSHLMYVIEKFRFPEKRLTSQYLPWGSWPSH